MPDDASVIIDILRAAKYAREFLAGLSREDLDDDLKTQSSVLHQLLIIGEATKRLSEGFRQEHPAIPWQAYAGMRDILIHAYDAVDLDEVWKYLSLFIGGFILCAILVLTSALVYQVARL